MKAESKTCPENWTRECDSGTFSWKTPSCQERNQLARLLVTSTVTKAPALGKDHRTQLDPRAQLTGCPGKDDGGRTPLADLLFKASPRAVPSQAGAQELKVRRQAGMQHIE